MAGYPRPRIGVVLFDEAHSESWSISRDKAAEIQPDLPANSCYSKWASELELRGFTCRRNGSRTIEPELLDGVDILVLPHPCDPMWEATTGEGSPTFSTAELDAITKFVHHGGGLIIITEYEHSKYGDNLDQLAARFGARVDSTTVRASGNSAVHRNPSWIGVTSRDSSGTLDLLANCHTVCFYRAGTVGSGTPLAVVRTPVDARPADAALAEVIEHGAGRVALVADSDVFGDEYWEEFDNRVFAVNLVWAVMSRRQRHTTISTSSPGELAAAFDGIAHLVNTLRTLQNQDGAVSDVDVRRADEVVEALRPRLGALVGVLPHQQNYLRELDHCLETWCEGGFQRPGFDRAVRAFQAETWRTDTNNIVAVFPMDTPNASRDIRFEALWLQCVWPEWLRRLNDDRYRHNTFVPCSLVDHTAGYSSHCAVLFPSSISTTEPTPPMTHFGIILCSREAERFTSYCTAGASTLGLRLPPELDWMLHDQGVSTEVYALWDLLHDQSHFEGYMPLIPFTEGVTQPYWMGAVEELRVDLEAISKAREIFHLTGNPMARMVQYTVILDRIIRFPVVGGRNKNFDALAGQILMGFLIDPVVPEFRYQAGRLSVDWPGLIDRIDVLREAIDQLYGSAVNQEPSALWRSAYRFVSRYVPALPGSRWAQGALDAETEEKVLLAAVLPDEFPLSVLYRRVLAPRLAHLEESQLRSG